MDPFTVISLGHVLRLFVDFMDVWQMPMFFYLSGQNVYSALFRRSETQFRDERVHRLLVPTLFLSLVTQFPLTLGYFAPRETPLDSSYLEYIDGFYRSIGVHQAWFLIYLFVFAQSLTFWFRAFHPAHNTAEATRLSYCESTGSCCTVKPFNCLTKFFCCLNFLFKPAVTPESFVSSVKWFLGGPVRLALLPGILIGLVQALDNMIPYDSIFFGAFSVIAFFMKSFPIFPFMVIFVLGYSTAAADLQIRQTSNLWSRTCFIVGVVTCIAVGLLELIFEKSGMSMAIVEGLLRGIGQWLLVAGVVALARKRFTEPRNWHHTFRTIAMPFYLIHQQVIVPIAAGALRVPYLGSFPVMIVLTFVPVMVLSFLITKSGPLRYFFGLPLPAGSWLPGRQMRGFVPVLVLSALVSLHILLANLL